MVGTRYGWLAVLGLFMVVSWIADSWARSAVSASTQYMGLGLYVVAQAIIFVPLLYIASENRPESRSLGRRGHVGAVRSVDGRRVCHADRFFVPAVGLIFGGFAALALIVVAILFGFELGPIFTVAMIALACGYILYDTSNVLHHYRIGQHVAAALALFASVALLFWYILRLFMSRRN